MLGKSSADVGHSWLYLLSHMAKPSIQEGLLFLLFSQLVLVGVKSLNIVFCVILLVYNFLELLFLLQFKDLFILDLVRVLKGFELLSLISDSNLTSLGVLHSLHVNFL